MKNVTKTILMGVSVLTLGAFTMNGAMAQDTETSVETNTTTTTDTDVESKSTTIQDSGVTFGEKTKIRGDVYTGSNTAETEIETDVETDISSDTSTDDIDVTGDTNTNLDDGAEINTSTEITTNNLDKGEKKGYSKQTHWEKRLENNARANR